MFKIGQKVVCIDDSNQPQLFNDVSNVVKCKIYTIREIRDTSGSFRFEEIIAGYSLSGDEGWFKSYRFRQFKYDILLNKEIIKEMLTEKSDLPIKEPVLN